MKPLLSRLLIIVARTVLPMVVLISACQSKLIYHPRSYSDGELRLSKTTELKFRTSDGEQVAWLLKRPTAEGEKLPQRLWIVFGGNGATGLNYESFFAHPELAHEWALLCDLPSYGHCQGKPSPESVRRTAQAVVPALAQQLGVSEAELRPKLRVLGHSIGCAAALMVVREHRLSAGVLVAPFTRMIDMARHLLGWPLCEVLRHRFDNVAELREIEAKGETFIAVFHGTEDEVIPLRMSEELANSHPKTVTFHPAKGGSHNEILDTHADEIVKAMLAR